jgi:hypothetical protein
MDEQTRSRDSQHHATKKHQQQYPLGLDALAGCEAPGSCTVVTADNGKN